MLQFIYFNNLLYFDNILFLKYRVSDQTNKCECEMEQTTYQYFEIWSLQHQGIKKQYIIKKYNKLFKTRIAPKHYFRINFSSNKTPPYITPATIPRIITLVMTKSSLNT